MSKEIEFLKDYEKVCRKHGFYLHGCGCCESPSVEEIKEKALLAWDSCFGKVCFQEEWWHKHKDFNSDFLLKETGEIEEVSKRRN